MIYILFIIAHMSYDGGITSHEISKSFKNRIDCEVQAEKISENLDLRAEAVCIEVNN